MNPLVDAHVTIVPPRLAHEHATRRTSPGRGARTRCPGRRRRSARGSSRRTASTPRVLRRARPSRTVALGAAVDDQLRAHLAGRSRPSPARTRRTPASRRRSARTAWRTSRGRRTRPRSAPCRPASCCAPLVDTSCRYAVEFTRPGDAASSHVRCSGIGISWLALTSATSARPPKLVSKPQMRCSRVEHRVAVAVRVLQLHVQTVRDDAVARLPRVDAGTGAQHDAGQVGADHVVRQVVPGRRLRPLQERRTSAAARRSRSTRCCS